MNTQKKHAILKRGAAVRLHGYVPARVLAVELDDDGRALAHCIVTARSPDWKAGNIGPHGYRTRERATVRACDAVPRDVIRVARGSGHLWWPSFSIVLD